MQLIFGIEHEQQSERVHLAGAELDGGRVEGGEAAEVVLMVPNGNLESQRIIGLLFKMDPWWKTQQ